MKNTTVIRILVLAILLTTIAIANGCTLIPQTDPCEREYTDCMHDCGEGILSSICNEKCTYDRNKCQEPKD